MKRLKVWIKAVFAVGFGFASALYFNSGALFGHSAGDYLNAASTYPPGGALNLQASEAAHHASTTSFLAGWIYLSIALCWFGLFVRDQRTSWINDGRQTSGKQRGVHGA